MPSVRNVILVGLAGIFDIWIPGPVLIPIFSFSRRDDFPPPSLAEPTGEVFPPRSFGAGTGSKTANAASFGRPSVRRDIRPRGVHRDLRDRPERSGKSRPGRRNGSRK